MGMPFDYWVRHPHLLWARLRYWWWEKRNPDKPWLTPGAVAFLDAVLAPEMIALEFGSGRSTAWFAGKVGRLVSVEHSSGWHAHVKQELGRRNYANVDYRLVPLNHPEAAPEQAEYNLTPAYVAIAAEFADGSFDLVVVDGHYRSHCIAAGVSKLKPGGLLVVDDANMWPGDTPPVPPGWPEVSRTTNGIKVTVIWRKPGAPDAAGGGS
jgi:predicted O-methyltransferase YrrM